MKQERIIESIDEIKRIASEINLFSAGKKGRIKVQLPLFTEEENVQIGHKIEKYYSACGCGQGRITGIITLGIFVVLILTGIISLVQLGIWNTIWLYFGCSMVTMFFGKLYGLRKARLSLIALADELELKMH